MRGIDPDVLHIEFGIERKVHRIVFVKLERDFAGIIRILEKLRPPDFGFVSIPVVAVVKYQGLSLLQGNAGQERDSAPEVNLAAGNLNWATVFCGPQLADFHLSLLEAGQELSAAGFGQRVHPKERTAAPGFSLQLHIGGAHVALEGVDCFLFQLRGGAANGKRGLQKNKQQACGNEASAIHSYYYPNLNGSGAFERFRYLNTCDNRPVICIRANSACWWAKSKSKNASHFSPSSRRACSRSFKVA